MWASERNSGAFLRAHSNNRIKPVRRTCHVTYSQFRVFTTVAECIFGAYMKVDICNDGPVRALCSLSWLRRKFLCLQTRRLTTPPPPPRTRTHTSPSANCLSSVALVLISPRPLWVLLFMLVSPAAPFPSLLHYAISCVSPCTLPSDHHRAGPLSLRQRR